MAGFRLLVIFNVIIAFFLFLSSQLVLYILNGKIVQGFGLFVDYSFPSSPEGPIPTIHAPLPNYPLFIFVLVLIVNLLYFVFVKRKKI